MCHVCIESQYVYFFQRLSVIAVHILFVEIICDRCTQLSHDFTFQLKSQYIRTSYVVLVFGLIVHSKSRKYTYTQFAYTQIHPNICVLISQWMYVYICDLFSLCLYLTLVFACALSLPLSFFFSEYLLYLISLLQSISSVTLGFFGSCGNMG